MIFNFVRDSIDVVSRINRWDLICIKNKIKIDSGIFEQKVSKNVKDFVVETNQKKIKAKKDFLEDKLDILVDNFCIINEVLEHFFGKKLLNVSQDSLLDLVNLGMDKNVFLKVEKVLSKNNLENEKEVDNKANAEKNREIFKVDLNGEKRGLNW